jgi:hypothetical protein
MDEPLQRSSLGHHRSCAVGGGENSRKANELAFVSVGRRRRVAVSRKRRRFARIHPPDFEVAGQLLPGLVAVFGRPARLEQEDQQRVAVFLDVAADAALVEPWLCHAMQGPAQCLVLQEVGVHLERIIPRCGELGVSGAPAVERPPGVARSLRGGAPTEAPWDSNSTSSRA